MTKKLMAQPQDNILVNQEGMAVLNDFGLSRAVSSSVFAVTTTPGNVAWTAPEIILSTTNSYQHTKESDIWSCGMTILVSEIT